MPYYEMLQSVENVCLYGKKALKEERAKRYLEDLIEIYLPELIKEYGLDNVPQKELDDLNNKRFGEESSKWEDDYFEGLSLNDFKDDFQTMFQQLRKEGNESGRPIDKKWIEYIQNTFNRYVSRFEKINPSIKTDFRNQVEWKGKKKKDVGNYTPKN